MTGTHMVLIHGAWAGPWVWDALLSPLTEAGHHPVPVTLPGVGDPTDHEVNLDVLTEAVLAVIRDLSGPLVIVAHSGGGVIATQVTERLSTRVSGVVYIAGMMLPPNTSFGDICSELGLPPTTGIGAYLQTSMNGRSTTVPAEAGAAIFFHGAEPANAIRAARMLRPQQESARLIAPSWTPDRYGQIPRLYIEALQDRSVPLATQRRMQELMPGTAVVTLDSDHAPQMSATDDLIAALIAFCASVSHPQ